MPGYSMIVGAAAVVVAAAVGDSDRGSNRSDRSVVVL